MKVFKAEFESGNWCYIFAESEEWAWHYFDKVMYESYSIKSFEEVASRNDDDKITVSSEFSELNDFEEEDSSIVRQDRTNRVVGKYIRDNLLKLSNQNNGNVIDITKLLNRDKKNNH